MSNPNRDYIVHIRFRPTVKHRNFPLSLNAFKMIPLTIISASNYIEIGMLAYFKGSEVPPLYMYDKFRLLIKLFIDYRLHIEKFTSMVTSVQALEKEFGSYNIMNFVSNEYMRDPIEPSQNDLLEHLDNLSTGDLKNAIPNLINWSDSNIGKNKSGFCFLRNAYQHPDLYESTKLQLTKLFDLPSVFNPDGSIDRTADNNHKNLELSINPLLKEIRTFFHKKYFNDTLIPFDEFVDFT